MGWNYYIQHKKYGTVHVGKSCIGWRFNFNYTKLLQFALHFDELSCLKPQIDNTLKNLRQLVEVEEMWYFNQPSGLNTRYMFTILTIDSDIIDKILRLDGVELGSDCEETIDIETFITRIHAETDKYMAPIGLGPFSGTAADRFC